MPFSPPDTTGERYGSIPPPGGQLSNWRFRRRGVDLNRDCRSAIVAAETLVKVPTLAEKTAYLARLERSAVLKRASRQRGWRAWKARLQFQFLPVYSVQFAPRWRVL